jgi:hypothetical protein
VVERVETVTVPVEMRNGVVLKSKDVTKITMRDTGETRELAKGVKPTAHADDEVELTLQGKLVTGIKVLKR